MQTLIIYDNEGFIISQMQGSSLREPVGIPHLWVEIPQGKSLASIDVLVMPNVPIFEELPKTETQLLQEKLDLMQAAIDELILAGGIL